MKLDLITDLPKLEQIEINGVRHYTATDGSIETIRQALGELL